ncbi:50S ribosomal protein L25 [Treponema phagedenis]|uniref:50S ribosomal protein L25 n=1 Tax=Treponema phagedenis TaxID=162 RepID=UPI0011E6B7F0|nr:50S ribosomal protein L25 [Treponema phagedenis]QEJ95768.1 50S ribosomal protein L25 [Treponema phagedenis]
MGQRILSGRRRTGLGKAAAARCRREGRLPAVMYDRFGKSIPIDVSQYDFYKLFRNITESTIITVKLDDKDEFEVFVKDYQHNIITDTVEHVDFYEVERGKVLRTKIQLRLSGSPEGVRQGAVLESGLTDIEVECLPKDLPERIIVDVSKLDLNEALHVRDIKVQGEVKILTDPDLPVATLKFVHVDIPETTEGEGETEEKADSATTEKTAE